MGGGSDSMSGTVHASAINSDMATRSSVAPIPNPMRTDRDITRLHHATQRQVDALGQRPDEALPELLRQHLFGSSTARGRVSIGERKQQGEKIRQQDPRLEAAQGFTGVTNEETIA